MVSNSILFPGAQKQLFFYFRFTIYKALRFASLGPGFKFLLAFKTCKSAVKFMYSGHKISGTWPWKILRSIVPFLFTLIPLSSSRTYRPGNCSKAGYFLKSNISKKVNLRSNRPSL